MGIWLSTRGFSEDDCDTFVFLVGVVAYLVIPPRNDCNCMFLDLSSYLREIFNNRFNSNT